MPSESEVPMQSKIATYVASGLFNDGRMNETRIPKLTVSVSTHMEPQDA